MLLIGGQIIRAKRSMFLSSTGPFPYLNRIKVVQIKGQEYQRGNIIRVLNSLIIIYVEKYHTC